MAAVRADHGFPVTIVGEVEYLATVSAAQVEIDDAAFMYCSKNFAHWAITSLLFEFLCPSVNVAAAGALAAVGPTTARIAAEAASAGTAAALYAEHPYLTHRLHPSFPVVFYLLIRVKSSEFSDIKIVCANLR